MAKKSLIAGLTIIVLSLCCGLCFAADDKGGETINLGNEITESLDKAGQSARNVTDNVFSGNMVNDAKDTVKDSENGVKTGMDDAKNGVVNMTGTNAGDYNATRTTTEGTAVGTGTMSTTTWMWIILAVAAIIIIAAIWYYATQNNDS